MPLEIQSSMDFLEDFSRLGEFFVDVFGGISGDPVAVPEILEGFGRRAQKPMIGYWDFFEFL